MNEQNNVFLLSIFLLFLTINRPFLFDTIFVVSLVHLFILNFTHISRYHSDEGIGQRYLCMYVCEQTNYMYMTIPTYISVSEEYGINTT